jgi:ATP adenylyltransferase
MDMEGYVRRSRMGPCFICAIIERNPEYSNYIVYESDEAIVFLNKYPTLYGYTLVAPRRHVEHATGDFTLDEYLGLQRVIYCVAEAVRQEVPTERMYILTLGSKQGNPHVHWHIAPLPPGVPYGEQQLEALMMDRGILKLSGEEMTALAERIGGRLEALLREVMRDA